MARDIAVTLTSDTRNFSRGLKSARDDLNLFGSSINSIKSAITGFLTFQGLKSGIQSIISTVGELDDLGALSDRLGVSTEFLSELQYAAKLSDTDIEALNGGLEKLEKNLGKATLEGGDLNKMLGRVGLEADELRKRGPEQAFLAIADAISRIADPIQRAAFVTEVFGKQGQSLIGILSKGRKGIQELRDEAKSLGITFSTDMKEKVGDADDAVKRMSAALDALKRDIALTFADSITGSVDNIKGFADAIRDNVIPTLNDMAKGAADSNKELKELNKWLSGSGIKSFLTDPDNFITRMMKSPERLKGLFRDRRRDMLPRAGGAAGPIDEMLPKSGGAAGPIGPKNEFHPGPAVNPGDMIDLGGILKDFKSFAKPLAIESKEGFSTIARALTQKTDSPLANKQLAEAKIANKHLGKIEDGLKNLPKVAPAF